GRCEGGRAKARPQQCQQLTSPCPGQGQARVHLQTECPSASCGPCDGRMAPQRGTRPPNDRDHLCSLLLRFACPPTVGEPGRPPDSGRLPPGTKDAGLDVGLRLHTPHLAETRVRTDEASPHAHARFRGVPCTRVSLCCMGKPPALIRVVTLRPFAWHRAR